MDTVLGRLEVGLDTLNPQTRKFLSFSSYIPRRIHLDSSSYRSLVCIFSHCIDHSLVPPSPAPETILSVKDPISSHERGELREYREASAKTDGGTLGERQDGVGDGGADVEAEGVSAAGSEVVGLDLANFDEKEIEACVNSEELRNFMLEWGDEPNEERSKESHEGNELDIGRDLVHGAVEGVSLIRKVSEVAEGEERVPNSLNEAEDMRKIAEDIVDLVIRESAESTDYERANFVETHEGNSERAEEKEEGKKQQPDATSISFVDYSGLRNLKEDQVRTLVHQIIGYEMEEGEISDGAMDLENLVDINDNAKVPEDQKIEGPSRDDFNEVASSTICVHKKEVTELGALLHDTSEEDSLDKANHNKSKLVKAKEKKKSITLTEERKAKKKIAKKRKRAQKNRQQGVKKLKLHTIVKPKEVKYCNFYRMGKCQQGYLCKFSHDTTPLTKSMPCKYFACNSCLKGDDCPYDHELSKYPCHNFMSKGCCNRADRCKFSHKIPTTDASSQFTVSQIDSHFSSEQLKLRNQPVDIGSFEVKTKDTLPLKDKPLKESIKVPKGIRFISTGTVQIDLTNKVKESLPVNKCGHTEAYNHEKHYGYDSAIALSLNALSPKTSMKSSGLVGDVSSGTANHEVLEAIKILEEFLFCGAD